MSRLRRFGVAVLVVVVVSSIALGAAGYFLFTRPHVDPLTKADAIVVLGGDKDGRVDYGLELARQGYADTVLVSTSASDERRPSIRKACGSGTATLTVICFHPDPATTLGEALFAERLATQHGWKNVIIVSWNFHMLRARYIFRQCFDGTVTMRPVPRPYDYGVLRWGAEYLYQYAGLAKAAILGCDRASSPLL